MSMAVVRCDVASEPASGSDKQKAPIFSPLASGTRYFCFCSSVPKCSRPQQTNELFTDMQTEVDASTLEISSIAKTYESVSMPLPPYLGSTIMPIKPSSPSCLISSAGNFCRLSLSITPGLRMFCAKSRAASLTARCSSVSSKFMLTDL